jgi:hypothetical protein
MAKLTGIRYRLGCALCMRTVTACTEGDPNTRLLTIEEAVKEGWERTPDICLCPDHATTNLSEMDRLTVVSLARARSIAEEHGLSFFVLDGQLWRGADARRATLEEIELWGRLR